jgi:hypothetical protein
MSATNVHTHTGELQTTEINILNTPTKGKEFIDAAKKYRP